MTELFELVSALCVTLHRLQNLTLVVRGQIFPAVLEPTALGQEDKKLALCLQVMLTTASLQYRLLTCNELMVCLS